MHYANCFCNIYQFLLHSCTLSCYLFRRMWQIFTRMLLISQERYPITLIPRMYYHLFGVAISLIHMKLRESLKFLAVKINYRNTSHKIIFLQSYQLITTCIQFCLTTLAPFDLLLRIRKYANCQCQRKRIILPLLPPHSLTPHI